MKHVLVINGHPEPDAARLCAALARAYQEGAEETGAMVRQLNVGALDFSLLRAAADFGRAATEETIVSAQSALLAADHVVFIFPLWLGGAPALLKAFMEQIGRDQFLLAESREGRFPRGRLKGRSARVIVTMGMPPLIYRLIFGAHGVKAFNGGILSLAGFRPIATSLFGAGAISAAGAPRTIEKVRALGRRLA